MVRAGESIHQARATSPASGRTINKCLDQRPPPVRQALQPSFWKGFSGQWLKLSVLRTYVPTLG